MIWGETRKERINKPYYYISTGFAFIPGLLDNGKWIWLEKYYYFVTGDSDVASWRHKFLTKEAAKKGLEDRRKKGPLWSH